MHSTEKAPAPTSSKLSQSCDAWLSLIQEPDQRWITQNAILCLLQTATANVDEFSPEAVEAASWLSMMAGWLTQEEGRERGFMS